MATVLFTRFVLPLFIVVGSLTTTISLSTATQLLTKLIHRDSTQSPYYNPTETAADRIARMMRISFARISYLVANMSHHFHVNDFHLNLIPTSYEPLFFVNFSIGQPPIPQLAIMDTGSSFLWVQCTPCKYCSPKIGPLFDPSKSSTYASLSCRDINCHRDKNQHHCNSFDQCEYNETYVTGFPSIGVLATEQLVFESSDEDIDVIVNNVIFGCSHQNGYYKDKRFAGSFGLGDGDTSVVTQMGSKFSYCIGNVDDPTYSYNRLILGDTANIEGYSTPLQVLNGHYHVYLEGISVGEKRLIIERKGAIIDTGTAPTWLAEQEYKTLEEEVRHILDGFLTPFWRDAFLCYKGILSQDLIGFPPVTFHLAGGADLVLDIGSMFYQATMDVFCMGVWQAKNYHNEFKEFSVIGLMAQQYYNMAYDLENYKLFFQRIDCELLQE